MPSASSKSAPMNTQVPNLDGQDPLKVVVSMMEKKVRNLEKRKTRLVSYTQQGDDGKELEQDQKDAVKKLEFVDNSLELAKEFHQIFKMMEQEHIKLQKKEQKRAKVEMKEKNSDERQKVVTQILEVQTLLENIDDDVKEDFLNGANGACKLEQEDLAKLDGIYKLITPSQHEDLKLIKDQVAASSVHMHCLLEEKDKPVLNTTYKDIFGVIKKVQDSKYFEKAEEEEEEEEKEEAEETPAADAAEADSAEEVVTGEEEVKETEDYPQEAAGETEAYSEAPSEPQVPQEASTAEHPAPQLVNGVDLPVEFSEAAADSALNFMGQSEVQMPASNEQTEEGKLSAASPEFIPRSLQSANSQPEVEDSGWNENEAHGFGESTTNDGGWQDVTPANESHHHQNRRGGPRGRDRGGFRGSRDGRGGGRGRGGYGQNNYHQRQERSDNYQRREGGNRGGRPRGGHPRGGRGDSRGAPRGNSNRGGFGRPQQQ